MARLIVKYTVEEEIQVEVKDYQLTEEELMALGDSKAEDICPGIAEDLEWEWVREPKAKGSDLIPPDDFWFNTTVGLAANNGWILICKHFLLPKEFELEQNWKDPKFNTPDQIEKLNEILSKDFKAFPIHKGWFRAGFRCLKDLKGVEVRGESHDEPGYLAIDGQLAAVLMPTLDSSRGAFRFND